jgi:hypothetical protein
MLWKEQAVEDEQIQTENITRLRGEEKYRVCS